MLDTSNVTECGGGVAAAKLPHPTPLPCLERNNSTDDFFLEGFTPEEQAKLRALSELENGPIQQLDERRFIGTLPDGSEMVFGGMSRSELKTAFVLEQNVAKLFRDYPIERIGFMTITFPDSVVTPKDASERFNSFNSHFLKDHREVYIKVIEPHKDKRPHFHLLVVLPEDIRTGFDWESYQKSKIEYSRNKRSKEFQRLTKQYSRSATEYLRDFWGKLRSASKSYRLGRTEILPIRSEAEAAVKYIGKYIEKGTVHRTGDWKGIRLTSCSRNLKREANCQFSWIKGGKKWREYVAEVARVAGIKNFDDMPKRFGQKWSFKILMCLGNGMTAFETVSFLSSGFKVW